MNPDAEPASFTIVGPLLWLPLLAAVLFAIGALLLKRSADFSVGVWRTTFISCLVTAAAFLPLMFFGGRVPAWTDLWQPGVVAGLFIVGQVTTVLALTRGDVSIAAPVLGLKIILVAIFSALLLAMPLPVDLWQAAALATVGVILLNLSGGQAQRNVMFSFTFAFLSALSFSLFDISVQAWAPKWGMALLPIAFAMSAVLAMGFIPLFEAPLTHISRHAWPWLAGGCVFIAFQSLGIVLTVAIWGHAAAANVVYSSRGLWSVALVGLVGPLLGGGQTPLSRGVLAYRLAGAALLLMAVSLLIL